MADAFRQATRGVSDAYVTFADGAPPPAIRRLARRTARARLRCDLPADTRPGCADCGDPADFRLRGVWLCGGCDASRCGTADAVCDCPPEAP